MSQHLATALRLMTPEQRAAFERAEQREADRLQRLAAQHQRNADAARKAIKRSRT